MPPIRLLKWATVSSGRERTRRIACSSWLRRRAARASLPEPSELLAASEAAAESEADVGDGEDAERRGSRLALRISSSRAIQKSSTHQVRLFLCPWSVLSGAQKQFVAPEPTPLRERASFSLRPQASSPSFSQRLSPSSVAVCLQRVARHQEVSRLTKEDATRPADSLEELDGPDETITTSSSSEDGEDMTCGVTGSTGTHSVNV